jgi:hypothetical protein
MATNFKQADRWFNQGVALDALFTMVRARYWADEAFREGLESTAGCYILDVNESSFFGTGPSGPEDNDIFKGENWHGVALMCVREEALEGILENPDEDSNPAAEADNHPAPLPGPSHSRNQRPPTAHNQRVRPFKSQKQAYETTKDLRATVRREKELMPPPPAYQQPGAQPPPGMVWALLSPAQLSQIAQPGPSHQSNPEPSTTKYHRLSPKSKAGGFWDEKIQRQPFPAKTNADGIVRRACQGLPRPVLEPERETPKNPQPTRKANILTKTKRTQQRIPVDVPPMDEFSDDGPYVESPTPEAKPTSPSGSPVPPDVRYPSESEEEGHTDRLERTWSEEVQAAMEPLAGGDTEREVDNTTPASVASEMEQQLLAEDPPVQEGDKTPTKNPPDTTEAEEETKMEEDTEETPPALGRQE